MKKKFDNFLIGKLVDLAILNKSIVKNTDWYKWFNYKKNTDYLEYGKFPNTLDDQLAYLENNLDQKNKILSNTQLNKKLQLGIIQKRTKN